jgi:ABC-2 type transport system permease protein/lipopolysaccharide transport system permease protein
MSLGGRRVSFTFGWSDILHRYRRSVLGPLWITASTAVMVVLYAELFRVNPRDFVPS